MRLEKRKELKEYTWKAMSPSAASAPAAQALSEARSMELRSVVGYQVRPIKRAIEKSEFTLTMPSKAIMCMRIVGIVWRDTSDISGLGLLVFVPLWLCGGVGALVVEMKRGMDGKHYLWFYEQEFCYQFVAGMRRVTLKLEIGIESSVCSG